MNGKLFDELRAASPATPSSREVSAARPGTLEAVPAGDPVALARRFGATEAEAADLRLQLKESLQREKRLLERALQAEEGLEDALRNEHDLREQIERYAQYHRAVERSRPWRALQFLRRLAGREW